MKLEQLMEGVPYTLVQGSPETEINDIIYDSRKAAPGLLFVCIVGTQRDSHEFAADCAAKDHAEQAPRGERAHESTRVRVIGPERMCNEQVGGVNDHEVVTIENHSEDHEEEHKPRVAVNSQMVYNL